MTDLSQIPTAELKAMLDEAKAGKTAPRKDVVTPNRPVSEFEAADTTTGAGFMTRFGASFKMTPEGKVGYLKHKYGDQNVLVDEKGNIYFRPKSGGRLTLFDEKDVSLADLADFAGDVPGVVMSAIGGTAGTAATPGAGNVAGAALGALVGNQAKQAISAMLPGDDNMSSGDRLMSMGTDAAMGGASQFGVNKMIGLRDLTRPGNIVARSAQRAEATPFAREGRQLSTDTGIPLSFAQETGSRAGTAVEGMARRNPVSADSFASFDRLQTDKAVQRIRGIMDDIHADEVGDVSLGQAAQRGFDNLWDRLVTTRRDQAARDFAEVTRLGGKEVLLPVSGTKKKMLELAGEFDVPGGGDATAKLARQIKAAADEIGLAVTPNQFNRLLQIYGKASAGKGTIFADLDSAQQRYLAGQIHSALTRDLDGAVAAGERIREAPTGDALRRFARNPEQVAAKTERGDVAAALKAARDNYAQNSGKMGEVGDSVIGRYFGNVGYERTPERVADMITKMKPTEIRATLGILSKADPDIADKTARHFIERALEKAAPPPSAAQGGAVKFTASRFLSALPDDATQAALFGGKPAQGELAKVAKVLERVSDRPMEGSPTAPIMMAWDLAKGLFTLNPQALAGLPVAVLAPRTIAKAALTPQGRQALITVSSTGKPTRTVTMAASYLAALNAREAGQDVDAAIAATPGAPTAR